ncbi:hypothetical protein [Gloeocapsopsis sp. IPPAS B-1203]|uniref:hypothetical protein n=1 Tax=Gloeocapsopsis sp. IPPAS B-1203 TaxID=2049454 RepID=UPI000C1996A1|nr:hypothetical protein [Gloeocapsopsis sp. IPPAS B-1203]PIG91663.1 hypothetical protein CSQ79_20795 [Gloeocapsopsis sp. IPPAS B-1203]
MHCLTQQGRRHKKQAITLLARNKAKQSQYATPAINRGYDGDAIALLWAYREPANNQQSRGTPTSVQLLKRE